MNRPARRTVLLALLVAGLVAVLAVAALLCFTGTIRAAAALDPSDHVPDHASVTYFDLVKQVVTDLDDLPRRGEPTAHTIVPYRHIEGDEAKTDPAGPVAIQLLTALTIHADGKPRLALMIDLGPSDGAVAEFTLLALFDTAEHPRLLDVVEVGTDRLTGFTDKPVLPLAQGAERKSDLIVIDSDHFNSNEDFVGTEFLFVRDDRFQLAGTLSTFDAKLCASTRQQLPAVTTQPDAPSRYRQIHVAVHETVTLRPDRAGCSGEKVPRAFTRTYHAIYRWNARRERFDITSSGLKQLDRENDKLMSGE
jgi:hypothetical protein